MNALSNRGLVQSFSIFLCFICVGSASLRAQTYTTAAGDAGNTEIWEQNSTWTPNTGFPNGTSNVANLAAINSASTLDMNTVGITVNSVNVLSGGTSSWTISNGQLTFAGATPGYSDQSSAGGNTISASVVLNADTTFNIGSTGGTTTSGAISGSSLTKTGAGTLTLTGTNAYTGGTTINGGTLQISNDAALGDTSGGVSINGGTLSFITLGNGGSVRPIALGTSGGTITTSVISGLTGQITGSGPLNLSSTSDSVLVLGNGVSNTNSGLTTIQAGQVELLANGYAFGGDVTIDAHAIVTVNSNEQLAPTSTLTINTNGSFDFLTSTHQTIGTLMGGAISLNFFPGQQPL